MNINYWGIFFFCFFVPICFIALMAIAFYGDVLEESHARKQQIQTPKISYINKL